jgi:hypothetical protein
VSEDRIRQFIQGRNWTPKQLKDIQNTWNLKHGWNHGNTPDTSLYTMRIVEEGLWLRRDFGWTLQDVVDLVVTFCKKNNLSWSLGRAKKQISDGQRHIAAYACQRGRSVIENVTLSIPPQHTPTLTCNGSQIIREETAPRRRS